MSAKPEVTFKFDIAPMFSKYVDQMKWRFDLGRYEDVKTNYEAICERIRNKGMPPPPFPHLSDSEIEMFRRWKELGFPP